MKHCPNCGKELSDDMKFCPACGRDLKAAPPTAPVKSKSAGLAVFLNMIPLVMGLGYIYIGKFKWFVLAFGLQLFSLFFFEVMGLGQYNQYFLLLIWIYSLFDVYAQTKRINLETST